MAGDRALLGLLRAIAERRGDEVARLLDADAGLAGAGLEAGRRGSPSDELFLEAVLLQIYVGDTALHVAAACYDLGTARRLLDAGADVHARNRRGALPLHAATNGGPGAAHWDPPRQVAMIELLLAAGADPDAPAAGGVTALHRAVRNRCSAAVRALLAGGANAGLRNGNGSTARSLADRGTGRGGTGSPEARAEQAAIVVLLDGQAG